MKPEFKDVAHLYLGCEMVNTTGGHYISKCDDVSAIIHGLCSHNPILRPLSDMTEDELLEWMDMHIYAGLDNKIHAIESAKTTAFLLSKGFDLFNLIDSGQAINKTKL